MKKQHSMPPCQKTGIQINDTVKTNLGIGTISAIYDDSFDYVDSSDPNDIGIFNCQKYSITHKLIHAKTKIEAKTNNNEVIGEVFLRTCHASKIYVLSHALSKLFNKINNKTKEEVGIFFSSIPEEWVEIVHK